MGGSGIARAVCVWLIKEQQTLLCRVFKQSALRKAGNGAEGINTMKEGNGKPTVQRRTTASGTILLRGCEKRIPPPETRSG